MSDVPSFTLPVHNYNVRQSSLHCAISCFNAKLFIAGSNAGLDTHHSHIIISQYVNKDYSKLMICVPFRQTCKLCKGWLVDSARSI